MGSLQVQLAEKSIKGKKRSNYDIPGCLLFYDFLLLIEKKNVN